MQANFGNLSEIRKIETRNFTTSQIEFNEAVLINLKNYKKLK